VIESTVKKDDMDTKQVREKYKELQNVEHAFRDMKTDKLKGPSNNSFLSRNKFNE